MSDGDYKAFLATFAEALIHYAEEAIEQRKNSLGTENELYYLGYLMGFHRVVTLLQQHAEVYDISLEELSLDKVDETEFLK
jgi:hypothetical protein